jgi:hypothetical protein
MLILLAVEIDAGVHYLLLSCCQQGLAILALWTSIIGLVDIYSYTCYRETGSGTIGIVCEFMRESCVTMH